MIKQIEIIETSPCMADKSKLKGITEADCDLTYLLPYINAEIPSADYKNESISFKKGILGFTIVNKNINITKFDTVTHLYEILEWVQDFLNDIESRMDTITPDYSKRSYPAPNLLYKELPGTNCGKCGMKSCIAFAGMLTRGNVEIEKCESIFAPENKEKLSNIQRLLK